ncbi:hypothetical protein LU646_11075 [Pseudomonas alloputida]|uniref:hypothetical protein n=1 Tax=Pseudomonas alloputida TaxID=1940621 RepID=UPI001E3861CF|nr:hypothetical protein [Pseudomonas alloputida]MCE1058424.1 hypothetical protein [Pseudomonas alloputida]
MVTLSRFGEAKFPDFFDAAVESISPLRLYYVYAGRNAWHSKWITRYSEGCMHVSLKSAKDYAEQQRVQGTVLNIREIPAIAFSSDAGNLIVTQINTSTPLSLYSPTALEKAGYVSDHLPTLTQDSYISLNAPIFGVAHSFSWWSKFWGAKPPASNSVIVVATRDALTEHTTNIEDEFKAYISYSLGSKYRLGWRIKDNSVSAEPIRRIMSHCESE